MQGVGFRPFVYRLASRLRLPGTVRNDVSGVTIEVEGNRKRLDDFIEQVSTGSPPLAQIRDIRVEVGPPEGLDGFSILASDPSSDSASDAVTGPARDPASGSEPDSVPFVCPDVATCDACLAELADPADRRHGYPFLNCTECGPRLTIIRRLPYDRPHTSMAEFPFCPRCAAEYEDPADRRFHAQPTACPECGPRLVWRGVRGHEGEGVRGHEGIEKAGIEEGDRRDALDRAVVALLQGRLVAIKGLGGFHLACDATDERAVRRLRQRKRRPTKPLAVMVADLAAARTLCRVGDHEAELLASPRRPIVLLEATGARKLASSVAPGSRWLGLMLPYTPLHHLLLSDVDRPLVMTSGNVAGEPIVHRSADADERLSPVADFILDHDRPIVTRCDDSVARVVDGRACLVRRSRGHAPEPVELPLESRVPLLAVGGQLKNVFCLVRGRSAFLSHHLGDLESGAAYRAFREGIEHYERLFDLQPVGIVHDLHPDYLSTRHARELAASRGIEAIAVQHHHAHVAACAAENGVREPVLGVAFDGTGYGPDGTVWGGEFLVADLGGFRRAARLRPVRLPGGEAAIREPWRVAAACLWDLGGPAREHPFLDSLDAEVWGIVRQMLDREINAPLASSAGRLFDAVAALAGICQRVSYEGEAAVGLESIVDEAADGVYPVEILAGDRTSDADGCTSDADDRADRPWEIDTRPLIEAVAADVAAGVDPSTISTRFHRALLTSVVAVCSGLRDASAIDVVALSGGVFQNAWLARRLPRALDKAGFRVLTHRRVPCNDGGIAYGQAAVAAARLGRETDDAVGHDAGDTLGHDAGDTVGQSAGDTAGRGVHDSVAQGRDPTIGKPVEETIERDSEVRTCV